MKQFVIASDMDRLSAGAVTYWRLQGATQLAQLAAAWKVEGLPATALPEAPSGKIALSRALRDQQHVKRKLVKAGGGFWALLDVLADAHGHVETQQIAIARYTDQGLELTCMPNAPYDLDAKIRTGFFNYSQTLETADVSNWLTKLADAKHATSLRESGGVYFLPQPAVAYWEIVTRVLAGCGHAVFSIPALRSDEAIAAILDSLTQEANAACAALHTEMGQPLDQLPGDRGLATKARACDSLATKIAGYAALLEVDLGSLQDRITRCKVVVESKRLELANVGEFASGSAVAGVLGDMSF